MTNRQDAPTFSTPDVLPSGQTGWTLTREERREARLYYRYHREVLAQSRSEACSSVALWLRGFASYYD